MFHFHQGYDPSIPPPPRDRKLTLEEFKVAVEKELIPALQERNPHVVIRKEYEIPDGGYHYVISTPMESFLVYYDIIHNCAQMGEL